MMKLTEEQLTKLIRLSNNPNAVSLAFGVGWVALRDVPENAWALNELTKPQEVQNV